MSSITDTARSSIHLLFFRWEIEQLYPAEAILGREAVQLAQRESGLPIAPGESMAPAMHFVNAEFASSDTSATVTMTTSLNMLVDVVKEEIGLDPQRNVAAIARFVTHLRYLFVRVNQEALLTDVQPALTHLDVPADIADLAERVRAQIECTTGGTLTDAEFSYLRLHVWRLGSIKR